MMDWQYSNYSKINQDIKKYFPFENPRHDQLETISEIVNAINNGYKYIVLEAGTGTGKSAIAATLANMSNSSYILTITKQLQDQYLRDFKDFKVVKGRSNFQCQNYIDKSCKEGKCIIISSHDIESLSEICDEYLIFTKSKIKSIQGNINRSYVNKLIGDSYEENTSIDN